MRRYIITTIDVVGLLVVGCALNWVSGRGFTAPSQASFAIMIGVMVLLRVNGVIRP